MVTLCAKLILYGKILACSSRKCNFKVVYLCIGECFKLVVTRDKMLGEPSILSLLRNETFQAFDLFFATS